MGNSFSSYSSTCIDITLIILDAVAFVLTLLVLIFVKWKNVSKVSLVIMIILLILITVLILFGIINQIYRKNGSIETTKREQARKITSAGFGITVAVFVICVIADIALGTAFNNANYPCGKVMDNGYDPNYGYNGNGHGGGNRIRNLIDKDSIDCSNSTYKGQYFEIVTSGEYVVSYFCISYTEIAMIVGVFLWRSLKLRQENGETAQPVNIEQPDQYPYPYNQQQYDSDRNPPYSNRPNIYSGGYTSQFQPQFQYPQQGQYPQQAQYQRQVQHQVQKPVQVQKPDQEQKTDQKQKTDQEQNDTPDQQEGNNDSKVIAKPANNSPVENIKNYPDGNPALSDAAPPPV